MKRIIIQITDEQDKAVRKEAYDKRLSISEIARRALDEYLSRADLATKEEER